MTLESCSHDHHGETHDEERAFPAPMTGSECKEIIAQISYKTPVIFVVLAESLCFFSSQSSTDTEENDGKILFNHSKSAEKILHPIQAGARYSSSNHGANNPEPQRPEPQLQKGPGSPRVRRNPLDQGANHTAYLYLLLLVLPFPSHHNHDHFLPFPSLLLLRRRGHRPKAAASAPRRNPLSHLQLRRHRDGRKFRGIHNSHWRRHRRSHSSFVTVTGT